MLTEVSGNFVKIAFADAVEVPLLRGHPKRPAARFNRPGQDALYLSPDEASARVAIGEYVQEGDPPRVLLSYEVDACTLLDLRLPEAADIYELARQSWRPPFARGEAPPSWEAADLIRNLGHVGLIDPSRQQPGLWHITLLRWNEPGAPKVRQIGKPVPISIAPKPVTD
ncbi:MAG: RES family NAD+ phosphorylase [Proteobacteria bacterium]|nr:RES family NAD+ phosphorylase [Pseudomonadota bacterium]